MQIFMQMVASLRSSSQKPPNQQQSGENFYNQSINPKYQGYISNLSGVLQKNGVPPHILNEFQKNAIMISNNQGFPGGNQYQQMFYQQSPNNNM